MSEVPIFVYEKCGSEVRSGQGVSNKEVASMQGAQYSDYSGLYFGDSAHCNVILFSC